jgi:hypothetical protein
MIMNLKKTLDSGAELEVTMAPFTVGLRLFKAVGKVIKEVDILGEAELFNIIKNAALGIVTSDEVESVLWECMGRATYNNRKVNWEIFEDEKIREDYLSVAKEVLWFNLSPFSKNLRSMLSDMQEKVTGILKQK